MKLNKLTFEWLIYHAKHSERAGHTELQIMEEIETALKAGTLEIEGYVRADHFADADKMVWTKFDSGKTDTYPPKTMFLAWGFPDPDCGETPTWFVCWRNEFGLSCDESAYPEIHYWKPLPKPPVETEAGK